MSNVKLWRQRFKQAVSEGRVRNRQSGNIAREYGIPYSQVEFWRHRKSYINYDNPLHKACASARIRMVAKIKDGDDLPPTVAQMRAWFEGIDHCYLSGKPLGLEVSVDHATPLSRGGDNSLSNLILVGYRDNQIKGQMTREEYAGFRLFLKTLSPEAVKDIEARLIGGGARRYGR